MYPRSKMYAPRMPGSFFDLYSPLLAFRWTVRASSPRITAASPAEIGCRNCVIRGECHLCRASVNLCRKYGVLREPGLCRNIDTMSAETSPRPLADADAFHTGDRIRKARELAGFPEIKDFAAATGLDRGALGRYESTGIVPRRGTLISIAMATRTREEWLESGRGQMFRDDDPPRPAAPEGRPKDYKGDGTAPININEYRGRRAIQIPRSTPAAS